MGLGEPLPTYFGEAWRPLGELCAWPGEDFVVSLGEVDPPPESLEPGEDRGRDFGEGDRCPCPGEPISVGLRLGLLKLSAPAISSRTEIKIAAQRSVKRRHLFLFICAEQSALASTGEQGSGVLLTSTICTASHMSKRTLAAWAKPGKGANSRTSAPTASTSCAPSTK